MPYRSKLKNKIENQVKRIKKAEHDRPNLLSQTIYIGTLGLVMILPVIGGVYLGLWLDSLIEGYSIHWTLGLMFVGLVIGGLNVYFLLRGR